MGCKGREVFEVMWHDIKVMVGVTEKCVKIYMPGQYL